MSDIEAIALVLAVAVVMLIVLLAWLLWALFHEVRIGNMWRNAYLNAEDAKLQEALQQVIDSEKEPQR